MVNKMRNTAKILGTIKVNPIRDVLTLRCDVICDYNNKIFYIIPGDEPKTWGLYFDLAEGFTKELVNGETNLSYGTVNGNLYWISVYNRPLTLDYYFNLYKDEKIYDTYRVIVQM